MSSLHLWFLGEIWWNRACGRGLEPGPASPPRTGWTIHSSTPGISLVPVPCQSPGRAGGRGTASVFRRPLLPWVSGQGMCSGASPLGSGSGQPVLMKVILLPIPDPGMQCTQAWSFQGFRDFGGLWWLGHEKRRWLWSMGSGGGERRDPAADPTEAWSRVTA